MMDKHRSFMSGMETRKILLLLLCVIFVPLLLIQAFTYSQWFDSRKKTEMQSNLEVARMTAKTFNRFVDDVVHTELVIGMAATASKPVSSNNLQRILAQAAEDTPAIRGMSWFDQNGKALLSSTPGLETLDISKTDFYEKMASGAEWVISDLFISRQTGIPVFTICRSIRDRKRNLLGIVGAAVDPERLDSVMGILLEEGGGIALTDSKGLLVFRWTPRPFTWEERNWLKRYPEIEPAYSGKEVATILRDRAGQRRIVALAPISQIGWLASSSRSEEMIVAPILSAILPQALLFLITVSATVIAALALSHPLVTSIHKLRHYAMAVGRGRMEPIEIIYGPREVTELSAAFNQMGREVKSREEALRQSEQKIRESQARLETVFSAIPDVIIEYDADLKPVMANKAALQAAGVTDLEFTWDQAIKRLNFRNLDGSPVTPDQLPIYRALQGHTTTGQQYRATTADGRERVVRIFTMPIHQNGKISGVVALWHDVTGLKRAEETLRESELQLKLAIRTARIGIFRNEFTSEGLKLHWDDTVREHWSLPKDLPISMDLFYASLHPDDVERVRLARELAFDPNGSGRYEIEYRVIGISDHVERWIRVSGQSQFEDGRAVRLIGTTLDITKIKQAEMALRRSRDELESNVRERTAELRMLNEELIQSRDALRGLASELVLAEERERKKLSIILHDEVAQSLAAARMRVDMLSLMVEKEEASRIVQEAQELIAVSIRQTRTLMSDLISPVLYDLGLKAAVQRLTDAFAESGITVVYSYHGKLDLSLDLNVTLYQIAKELLKNIEKHSQAKNVSVSLAEDTGFVQLLVSDDGQGFDTGKLSTPGGEGGFGLFSIRERVSFYCGKMDIQSGVGKGTRIAIEIPKREACDA